MKLYNVNREQQTRFVQLYSVEKKPLRAVAAELGLDIITATVLAQQTGGIRYTEAVILNSKSGEQGRMGEEIFQKHLPQAINCNLAIKYANKHYDFLLDGLRIDIKTSAGFIKNKDKNIRLFPFSVKNAMHTDLYVVLVKSEVDTPNQEESYRHCFIIPSLFVMNLNSKLEIRAEAIHNSAFSYHEYCYPIEEMANMVQYIADNRAAFAIPEELKPIAQTNRELKKEANRAKRNRTTA